MLADSGIPSMLKNELVWWTPGARIVGPLAFAWPEVWVNESDWETASEVLKGIDFEHHGILRALGVWITYTRQTLATLGKLFFDG